MSAAAASFSAALECFEKCTFGSEGLYRKSRINYSVDIAVALGNIGAVFWRTGKTKEAISSLEKCLRFWEIVCSAKGKSSTVCGERASTLYSIGLARIIRYEYAEAIEALTCAKEILLESYGKSHVEIARVEDALGKCFLIEGNVTKAMEYHSRVLKTKTSLLGKGHPSVLVTKLNLAAVFRVTQELNKAISIYREVLSAQKLSFYGETDENTRQQLTSDIGTTLRLIGEAQKEFTNNNTNSTERITPREEKKPTREIGLAAGCDWDLYHSPSAKE